jgi:hypothetical protein
MRLHNTWQVHTRPETGGSAECERMHDTIEPLCRGAREAEALPRSLQHAHLCLQSAIDLHELQGLPGSWTRSATGPYPDACQRSSDRG